MKSPHKNPGLASINGYKRLYTSNKFEYHQNGCPLATCGKEHKSKLVGFTAHLSPRQRGPFTPLLSGVTFSPQKAENLFLRLKAKEPYFFKCSESHLKNSECHTIPFCGLNTQCPSLGKYKKRDSTPWICAAWKASIP